jgi:hypothetical protein
MHRSRGDEEVLAFLRFEEADVFAGGGPKTLDGSLGGFSQERLQCRLGEDVFNRVEVRAVGREIEKFGAGRFEHLTHPRAFGARQIDRGHDVAHEQFGDETFGPSITNGAMKPRSVSACARSASQQRGSRIPKVPDFQPRPRRAEWMQTVRKLGRLVQSPEIRPRYREL